MAGGDRQLSHDQLALRPAPATKEIEIGMAALARAVATLRLFGDDLDPERVSELLGVSPTWSERKGDVTPSKSPGGARIARTGSWRLQAADSTGDNADRQISEILDQLTTDLDVWKSLAARFDVDLFCGWFLEESNEGVTLSSNTLLALGERGIELDVDIYGSGKDD